ncbi:MAG TPA: M55 family metallopeptidase [Mycobacteriales bacterium]|jgi:D-amino peptidase|nr:M55 family metallopeptidase [Mycobacteriales bacterium]
MKSAFVITDLEGTAGVTSFTEEAYADAKYLDRARRLATAELNAAVEGLLAVGVADILVWDGHGAGGLWYEDLHPAVRLIHGRPSPPISVIAGVVDGYEAGIIIGQHAMAGVASSNMNHTQSSTHIDHITLNGQRIGEIAQSALFWGAAGMPFVFLSGEQAACDEAVRLIPGIGTAAVKQGLGRGSAISVSASEARNRITAGISRAAEHHRAHPIPPTVWDAPYVLEKRFFHTDAADASAAAPGAERVDGQTVRFHGDDIRSVIYR